jgi:hypothetical protein
LFDSFLIREDSLENVVVDGKITGFKFAVRIADYRGEYLSLQNGYYVNVDGAEYPREMQMFEVNGKAPRTFDEIAKAIWEHWDFDDDAYLHIEKTGGLSNGLHHIGLQPVTLASYGYTNHDKEWVTNPPVPGSGEGIWKNFNVCWYNLQLKQGGNNNGN